MKRWGYLLFLLVVAMPPAGWLLGRLTGLADGFAFLTLVFAFVIVPLADFSVGTDTSNPEPAEEAVLEQDPWYRVLPFLAFPACLALVIWAGWAFAHGGYGWVGRVGHVLSVGAAMGIVGITAAHELIHKAERLDQRVGGWLLTLVCYGGFKIEHVRGHHVYVSTPEDRSSAWLGQSVYRFLPRALCGNFLAAWRLEAARLRSTRRPLLSSHNEMLRLWGLSAVLCAGFGLAFGGAGVAFFLAQSLVAVTELEIVNYIEHYGLRRRRLANGRWERPSPRHSWNAPWRLTNLFLFQLQRHSDHHAEARRRYSALRHHDDAPMLPAGYPALVLLALAPPLWFRVMNPRVHAWRGDTPAGAGG